MNSKSLSITPVILCGGSGTRLWPLSRSGFPKQFLTFSGNLSLFQEALTRVNALAADDFHLGSPIVVTNEEHRFIALEQMRELNCVADILLEPVGRNTAPALTLAALQARKLGNDPILVVIPADQTVSDQPAFLAAIEAAIHEAAKGFITILGIKPQRPETGYGYIKIQDTNLNEPTALGHENALLQYADVVESISSFLVERFVEKPDATTAHQYLDEGCYYWNAGIFVLKASVWLSAIKHYRPDILHTTESAWVAKTTDNSFIRPEKAEFSLVPAESVDYAVMEPATEDQSNDFKIRMIPLAAGWSDLGAWDAVWDAHLKDQNGNAHVGDVLSADSRNTLVHATSRMVGVVGVENLVIVETADSVLVANKSRSQDVKQIVTALNQLKREEHVLHRKVYRPWGWYDTIDKEENFKVKRILVKPGASLSLQMHQYRAEHWVVVKGTAQITIDDQVILLGANQSTYIPVGKVHRLTNPDSTPLEIIEVQSGSYLSEDDIVRFEDQYGRS